MRSTSLSLAVLVLSCLAGGEFGGDAAFAQPAQQPSRVEPGLALTVEGFCSEAKLRTSNARIRWSMPKAALDASGLGGLAAARQSLEVTVYKSGFDKGLLVALPIAQATPDRPILPQTQARQPLSRAFQISLIGVEQPGTLSADGASEMGAVVEGLEPGVNYTWRIAIDTPSGRIVSPSATSQARVCPADEVRTSIPGGTR